MNEVLGWRPHVLEIFHNRLTECSKLRLDALKSHLSFSCYTSHFSVYFHSLVEHCAKPRDILIDDVFLRNFSPVGRLFSTAFNIQWCPNGAEYRGFSIILEINNLLIRFCGQFLICRALLFISLCLMSPRNSAGVDKSMSPCHFGLSQYGVTRVYGLLILIWRFMGAVSGLDALVKLFQVQVDQFLFERSLFGHFFTIDAPSR